MESSSLTVKYLGIGPHYAVSIKGLMLTVDGYEFDLAAAQKDEQTVHDIKCDASGRYKATVIIPPAAYDNGEGESESDEESSGAVKLSLRVEDVKVRVYPCPKTKSKPTKKKAPKSKAKAASKNLESSE